MVGFQIKNNDGDTELWHGDRFLASWNEIPSINASNKGVIQQMLSDAYAEGQRDRSAEINEALRKLGVLK